MWFIVVEVEGETRLKPSSFYSLLKFFYVWSPVSYTIPYISGAPTPKNNPRSAPVH